MLEPLQEISDVIVDFELAADERLPKSAKLLVNVKKALCFP